MSTDYKQSPLAANVAACLERLDADRTKAWDAYVAEDRAHKETKARLAEAECRVSAARTAALEAAARECDRSEAAWRALCPVGWPIPEGPDGAHARMGRERADQSAALAKTIRSLKSDGADDANAAEPPRCHCGGVTEKYGLCHDCYAGKSEDEAEARAEAEKGTP